MDNSSSVKILVAAKSVLPTVSHSSDRCLRDFQQIVATKLGIDKVHVVEQTDQGPGQFCIHFNPEKISVASVRDLAQRVGSELDARYGHLDLRLEATYAHRARAIELRLDSIDGVIEAVVAPDGALRVEFDRQRTNAEAIKRVLDEPADTVPTPSSPTFKRAKPAHDHNHAHEHDHDHAHHSHDGPLSSIFGKRTELIFAILSGVFTFAGWLLTHLTALPPWSTQIVYAVAYFFGGYFALFESLEKLWHRKFEVDLLMIVAAIGAAIIGSWAEGALLLFLFSIGHALEAHAMGRAKSAIEALGKISPKTAHVLRDGVDLEVPVEELILDDVVIVKPDERIPADGFVIEGTSTIDQAAITGESIPVEKQPVPNRTAAAALPNNIDASSRVFAGTINGAGGLKIQVTRLAGETMLARVVAMVHDAQTRVSPAQQFAKQIERYFVPGVMIFLVLLLFAPLVLEEPFSASFYRCMTVAVAASPCALAISTPSAVLSAIARAATAGVLVKGSGPLETLGRIDTIAFDKTGTLTRGEPSITDIWTADGVSESELLRIAIAVELQSPHPLAKAIVRDAAKTLGLDPSTLYHEHNSASEVQSVTGQGIQATIDDRLVRIGNRKLFERDHAAGLPAPVHNAVQSLEQGGRTLMIVHHGDRFLGAIGLMDQPRQTAKETIARLKAAGIRRMIMISGDNQSVASAVAASIGLDEARGNLMPDEKVAEIRRLNSERGIAMVGDGVNDAPAMAAAAVGVAMGAAGSDVALETADIALVSDKIELLPFAIHLGRATSRIIRQNLWISLGMVAFLVPSTLFGLSIGPAVLLHEGSTVVVVLNALRLLRFQHE